MSLYLTTRMGESRENPPITEIETAVDELLVSKDEEHNSIAVSNDEGYFLEIYLGVFVILENLNNPSFKSLRSRVVSRERISQFINTFIDGDLNTLQQDILSSSST